MPKRELHNHELKECWGTMHNLKLDFFFPEPAMNPSSFLYLICKIKHWVKIPFHFSPIPYYLSLIWGKEGIGKL